MKYYAFELDDKLIYYYCDRCFNKLKKNGTRKKNSKPRIHSHGHDGCLLNKTVSRYSNCVIFEDRDIEIIINDQTKRLV